MNNAAENQKQPVIVVVTSRNIILRLPKDPEDIAFIRSLGRVRWDTAGFCWVIPDYPANREKIKKYFGKRLRVRSDDSQSAPGGKSNGKESKAPPEAQSLVVVRYHNGRIRLIFRWSTELIKLIKRFPLYSWDVETQSWTLPHTEKIMSKLQYFCKINDWKYRYVEDIAHLNRKSRPRPADIPNYRKCPDIYLERLTVLRYSPNTIHVYTDCFTEFINYFSTRELDEITQSDILIYLRYLIEERCVSTSYQNQAINSIKFYYEKIAGRSRETFYIDRPRKEKFLPSVLSEAEVKRIIDSIRNIKHKCMIMTAYSAGLRVSELLDLKVNDIDSNRMLIRIFQGKGRRDRVTLLSVKLLALLREYYKEYHPKEYLFEGITGGRYAERSVQNVLKNACRDAKVFKQCTMHTLRHSFATHLLEHNTDIRYIQDLLGHANPKTTQIYTHITTRGLDQLKSPLDNLDL
jgi:site-specific recombinase XerD